jgi:hypothetical protein
MEYTKVFDEEGFGDYGEFGIRIFIGTDHELNADERITVREAASKIRAAVMERSIALNSTAREQAAEERKGLLGLFPDLIYAEEIPNGYCSQWCCKHLPWFIVTTRCGRIKIGWRKRVIEIDWSDSAVTATAEKLFPNENVTKDGRIIHAWGYDKAREYIDRILTVQGV